MRDVKFTVSMHNPYHPKLASKKEVIYVIPCNDDSEYKLNAEIERRKADFRYQGWEIVKARKLGKTRKG